MGCGKMAQTYTTNTNIQKQKNGGFWSYRNTKLMHLSLAIPWGGGGPQENTTLYRDLYGDLNDYFRAALKSGIQRNLQDSAIRLYKNCLKIMLTQMLYFSIRDTRGKKSN